MLLYWALLLDLTIFSMQISAFTLVCGRVLSELGLFIGPSALKGALTQGYIYRRSI